MSLSNSTILNQCTTMNTVFAFHFNNLPLLDQYSYLKIPAWIWRDKLFWQRPFVLKIGNKGQPSRASKTGWQKQVGLAFVKDLHVKQKAM